MRRGCQDKSRKISEEGGRRNNLVRDPGSQTRLETAAVDFGGVVGVGVCKEEETVEFSAVQTGYAACERERSQAHLSLRKSGHLLGLVTDLPALGVLPGRETDPRTRTPGG